MVSVKFVLPAALLAVITYPVELEVTVGVPLITPLEVFRLKPVGSDGDTL
jgi:hypothetical protein